VFRARPEGPRLDSRYKPLHNKPDICATALYSSSTLQRDVAPLRECFTPRKMRVELLLRSLECRLEALEARAVAAEAGRAAADARIVALEKLVYRPSETAALGRCSQPLNIDGTPASDDCKLEDGDGVPDGNPAGCARMLLPDRKSGADAGSAGGVNVKMTCDDDAAAESKVFVEDETIAASPEDRILTKKRRYAESVRLSPGGAEDSIAAPEEKGPTTGEMGAGSSTGRLRRRKRRWRRSSLSAEKALEPPETLPVDDDAVVEERDAPAARGAKEDDVERAEAVVENVATVVPYKPIVFQPLKFTSAAAAVRFLEHKQTTNDAEEAGVYNETVRGKARAALNAISCQQCEDFYRAAAASDHDPVCRDLAAMAAMTVFCFCSHF
jgi:hypothetical protein